MQGHRRGENPSPRHRISSLITCPSTHALPYHLLPAAHSSSLDSPRVRRTGGCRTGSLPIRSMKPLNSETADLEATCGRIRFVSRSFGARVQSPRPESAVFLDPCERLSSIRALETRPIAAMARDVWLVPSGVPTPRPTPTWWQRFFGTHSASSTRSSTHLTTSCSSPSIVRTSDQTDNIVHL